MFSNIAKAQLKPILPLKLHLPSKDIDVSNSGRE